MTLTPKMLLFTVFGTTGFLALAVLGEGVLAAYFAHAPLVAVAIATVAITGIALFSSANLSGGEREDRGSRWVLAAFGVLGLLGD